MTNKLRELVLLFFVGRSVSDAVDCVGYALDAYVDVAVAVAGLLVYHNKHKAKTA